MKSRMLTLTCSLCVVFVAVLATSALSHEKESKPDGASQVAALQNEIAETLQQALEAAVEDYHDGDASPEALLRINAKLYEAQLASPGSVTPSMAAKTHLGHARDIETLAKKAYRSDRGSKHELLEATAAKLRAELELKRLQASR